MPAHHATQFGQLAMQGFGTPELFLDLLACLVNLGLLARQAVSEFEQLRIAFADVLLARGIGLFETRAQRPDLGAQLFLGLRLEPLTVGLELGLRTAALLLADAIDMAPQLQLEGAREAQ